MTRTTIKLLTALFALGCGSGAMASPDRGQWTGDPGYYGNDLTGTNNNQATPTPPTQSQLPQPMGSTGEDQNQPPSTDQQAQGGYHPDQDQDQDDDDTAETRTFETGQSHLGVMVMGLTRELRQFFGVIGDRGVLIAKVEPGSAASRAGIQVGDVLVRVGRNQVRSGDDVLQALAAQPGERIRIVVVRHGQPVRLAAQLPGQQRSTSSQSQQNRL